ncbi:MAG: hypothetical protein AAFY26_12450 [Cyanobacteria bacterium J06638_22]
MIFMLWLCPIAFDLVRHGAFVMHKAVALSNLLNEAMAFRSF